VVSREKVSNAPGIYLIFKCDDLEHPLYIGKAGTIKTDGSWKDQKLSRRLRMKQGHMFRREFFSKLMADKGLAGLTFFLVCNARSKQQNHPGFGGDRTSAGAL